MTDIISRSDICTEWQGVDACIERIIASMKASRTIIGFDTSVATFAGGGILVTIIFTVEANPPVKNHSKAERR